jgi:uncharacterized protein
MTTGETGMMNQVIGLAEAMGTPFEIKTVHPKAPWRGLPGHWAASVGVLGNVGVLASAPPADGLRPPWPDLLITCGRRSVALAIAIKRASGDRAFTVHIQNPRAPIHYFDLIAAPEHDRLTGPNVISTMGALHRLTREALAASGERFRQRFAHLKQPFAAVLIGGKSKSYILTPERARELARQLRDLAASREIGLAVTVSRRTGPENTAILKDALAGSGAFFWDGEGENPYFAMLELADWIIVTEDSASMVSEACFTGKPVYVAALDGGARRFQRMHKHFREGGFARPFAGDLEDWTCQPLDETRRVAAIVRERMEQHHRRWAARRETRWELIDGRREARPPETALHDDTRLAIASALRQAVERAGLDGCLSVPDGAMARIDDRTIFAPDALVQRGDGCVVIVVETLSPSSALLDLRDKLEGYFQAPEIQHYLICDPEKRLVIHHARGLADERETQGAVITRLARQGTLTLGGLGSDLPNLTLDVANLFVSALIKQ